VQTLEQGRDIIRRRLHHSDAENFPYGQIGGHIDVLVHHILGSTTYSSTYQLCRQCNMLSDFPPDLEIQPKVCPVMDIYPDSKWSSGFQRPYYVQDWLQHFVMHSIEGECLHCSSVSHQFVQVSINQIPPLLYFNIYDKRINVGRRLFLDIANGEMIRFTLKATTYFGNYHFTCRSIDTTGAMFYHDGITCGTYVHNEQLNADTVNDEVFKTADNGKKFMIGALYVKD